MLEIGAASYYPERRAVNAIADAPPVHATLSTMKSVIDTAKPQIVRLSGTGDTALEQRQRRYARVYLTSADIARMRPAVTSDLFRAMRGVRLDASKNVQVRGVGEWCSPAIYIDGTYMPHITSEGIDGFVHPADIASIEIFTGYATPPQFRNSDSDCGSMAISTNAGRARRP